MNQLDIAKQAIRAEIARLAADQKHLQDVLSKLDGGSGHVPGIIESLSHPIDTVKNMVAGATGKKTRSSRRRKKDGDWKRQSAGGTGND